MDTSHEDSILPEEVDQRPRHDERGAHLVEYAMIIALIVVVCVAGVSSFGESVPASAFSQVSSSI